MLLGIVNSGAVDEMRIGVLFFAHQRGLGAPRAPLIARPVGWPVLNKGVRVSQARTLEWRNACAQEIEGNLRWGVGAAGLGWAPKAFSFAACEELREFNVVWEIGYSDNYLILARLSSEGT